MKKFRPIYAILAVALFAGGVMAADWVFEGGLRHAGYERVSPGRDGAVRISLADLGNQQVRFYRFLNAGNQEVKFFVGRDAKGVIQVAFDANELCYKLKRGYRHEEGDAWIVCNKCDRSFRLDQVNAGGGGCNAVPVAHRVDGDQLVLAENDLLAGWRYFR